MDFLLPTLLRFAACCPPPVCSWSTDAACMRAALECRRFLVRRLALMGWCRSGPHAVIFRAHPFPGGAPPPPVIPVLIPRRLMPDRRRLMVLMDAAALIPRFSYHRLRRAFLSSCTVPPPAGTMVMDVPCSWFCRDVLVMDLMVFLMPATTTTCHDRHALPPAVLPRTAYTCLPRAFGFLDVPSPRTLPTFYPLPADFISTRLPSFAACYRARVPHHHAAPRRAAGPAVLMVRWDHGSPPRRTPPPFPFLLMPLFFGHHARARLPSTVGTFSCWTCAARTVRAGAAASCRCHADTSFHHHRRCRAGLMAMA